MTRVWFHPVFQLFGSVENLILWGSHYFLFRNKRKFITSCLDLSPNRPDQELLLTKFHFYLISGHTEQSVQFFSEWDSSSKVFFSDGDCLHLSQQDAGSLTKQVQRTLSVKDWLHCNQSSATEYRFRKSQSILFQSSKYRVRSEEEQSSRHASDCW